MTPRRSQRRAGFGLVDIMIALSLASFLILALVRLVLAATGSYRLQQDLGDLQQDARFALETLRTDIAQAGFSPQPWLAGLDTKALSPTTADTVSATSDRLALRRWSDRNCYGTVNPKRDLTGRPRYFLLESTYSVNKRNDLAWTCRYGADEASLVRQVNGLSLVPSVEAFRLRFAEDSDGDGSAGRWVRANGWLDENHIRAIKVGLILSSKESAGDAQAETIDLMGEAFSFPADGRLRQPWTFTTAIRGRL